MPFVQSVWNALETAWYALLQSPHRIGLYAAAAAVLIFLFLVMRVTRSRGPATLSLNQPSWKEPSRRRGSFDQTPVNPLSLNQPRPGAITPGWAPRMNSGSAPARATVTPINRAPVARCTHCQAPLTTSTSFCDACGFAQPAMQTGTNSSR